MPTAEWRAEVLLVALQPDVTVVGYALSALQVLEAMLDQIVIVAVWFAAYDVGSDAYRRTAVQLPFECLLQATRHLSSCGAGCSTAGCLGMRVRVGCLSCFSQLSTRT
jgi:hypothetical protein